MDELYLCGQVKDDSIHLTSTSAVTLFVLKYCQTDAYKIHYVDRAEITPVHLSRRHVSDVVLLKDNECPKSISQCSLPAVRCCYGNKVLSGLCGVLRNIIKVTANQESDIIDLLAHKQICLKACAEISMWTRFCEVELPNLVENVLTSNSCLSGKVSIPGEFMKLENQFKQPCTVANIQKRIQSARKKIASDKDAAADKHMTTHAVTKLKHSYVEGPDFTLADLALFPCLVIILNHWKEHISSLHDHLPLISEWLNSLYANDRIHAALALSGLPIPDISLRLGHSSSRVNVFLPTEVSSVREVKKKKFKANFSTIQLIMDKMKTQNFGFLGNHPCSDIGLPWKQYPEAVHPKDGDLPQDRLARKCEQLENLAQAVTLIAKPGDTIVDFCAGGGHLGILLAYLLPNCQVLLIENKEESIQRAECRINKLQLTNVTIYQCNLDYYHGEFDIGVCLHACGVATDLVMQCCLHHSASFVICPCCYGNIQNTHTVTYPRSQAFTQFQLTYQEYISLGHGADQTEFNSPAAKQGKQCMIYIDSDRASLASEYGYSVTITTLQPPQCSPKNNLIIGYKIT